jgi:hypothetical protein
VGMYTNQGNKNKLPTPDLQDLNVNIKKELYALEHVCFITKLQCKLL